MNPKKRKKSELDLFQEVEAEKKKTADNTNAAFRRRYKKEASPIDAALRYIQSGVHLSPEVRKTLIEGMRTNPQATTQHIIQDHVMPFVKDAIQQGSANLQALPKETQVFVKQFLKNVPSITQAFGNYNPDYYSWGSHTGTDFGTAEGTAVRLPKGTWTILEAHTGAGKGSLNDWTNRGYGNSVLAQNENGEKVRFSHLQATNMKPGQVVSGGTLIGTTGSSGHSDGAHVDIEYYDKKGKLSDVTSTPMVEEMFVGDAPDAVKPMDKKMVSTAEKVEKLDEKKEDNNPFLTTLKAGNDVGRAFANTIKPVSAATNTMTPSRGQVSPSFSSTPARSAPASSSSSSGSRPSPAPTPARSTPAPAQTQSRPQTTYNAPTKASTWGGAVKQQSYSAPKQSSAPKSQPKSNPVQTVVNAIKRFFGW